MAVTYIQGAELGDLQITWLDEDGQVIDFSTGWTFELRVGKAGKAASIERSTAITGDSDAPNVVIGWPTTGELNDLAVAVYTGQVTATRSSDGKQRIMQFQLRIVAPVLAAA